MKANKIVSYIINDDTLQETIINHFNVLNKANPDLVFVPGLGEHIRFPTSLTIRIPNSFICKVTEVTYDYSYLLNDKIIYIIVGLEKWKS